MATDSANPLPKNPAWEGSASLPATDSAAEPRQAASFAYRGDLALYRASKQALIESSSYGEALLRFRRRYLEWKAYDLVPEDWTCLPYPEGFEDGLYAAATFVAYCETFRPWDELVSGRRGRPRRVRQYKPWHDDASALRHLKLAYRRWLSSRVGFDKDSERWQYKRGESYALSLDEALGEDGEFTRADAVANQSLDAIDPAILLDLSHPEYDHAFAWFERREIQGWRPGRPPIPVPSGAPATEETLRALAERERESVLRRPSRPILEPPLPWRLIRQVKRDLEWRLLRDRFVPLRPGSRRSYVAERAEIERSEQEPTAAPAPRRSVDLEDLRKRALIAARIRTARRDAEARLGALREAA